MSVFIDPRQSVIDLINHANSNASFTLENVKVSIPYQVSGGKFDGTTALNTWVWVAPYDGSTYKGRVRVFYNRLQLSDYSKLAAHVSVKSPYVSSVHYLLDAIRYYLGLYLTIDDVIDDPIALDETGSGTVTVRAKDTSKIWLGELSVSVVPGGVSLSNYLSNQPTVLSYPISNLIDGVWGSALLYSIDATAYRDNLLPITPGTLHGDGLNTVLEMLLTLDLSDNGSLWNNSDTSDSWSLDGATVVYNGLNDPVTYPSNSNYKYLLAIDLKSAIVNPEGRLFIHYNDPNDPNTF